MIRVIASYDFRAGGNGIFCLAKGWSAPDPTGAWSDAAAATLTLPPIAQAGRFALEIHIDPQLQRAVTRHVRVAITLNGARLDERRLGGELSWLVAVPDNTPLELTISLRGRERGERRGVRLAAIDVVRLGHAPLPPPATERIELRFGWNETTEHWLGDGFGTPEDEYVWAVGPQTDFCLPVPPDGAPCLALLDMRPFHRPPDPPRQRVILHAGDAPKLHLDLRDRLTVAVDMRPSPGQTSVPIRCHNLDADFITTDPFYHFGKPFAWALASARIVPALPRYLPAIRPRLPGTMADGSLQQAVQSLTFLSAAELADRFEGLGNGCELGNLQVALGHERIGLLRYSAIRQRELVEGIFRGFHGIARAEKLKWDVRRPEDDTWRLVEEGFGVSSATPYKRDSEPPPEGLALCGRRLPRLADRLMEEVAAAERIFVLRISEPMGEPAARAVLAALRHYGPAEMIWLVTDGTHRPGTVERLECGLIRGHLESPETGREVSPDSMLSALANAYVLLRQAQPLPP